MYTKEQKDKFQQAERECRKVFKKYINKFKYKFKWSKGKYNPIDCLLINDEGAGAAVELKLQSYSSYPLEGWCMIEEAKFNKVKTSAAALYGITPVYVQIYFNKITNKHTFYVFDLSDPRIEEIETVEHECKYQTVGNSKYVTKKIRKLPVELAKIEII